MADIVLPVTHPLFLNLPSTPPSVELPDTVPDETKIKDGRDDLGTHRMDRLLSKTDRWTPAS